MPNIYKINVSPKPLTNLTVVLTFTDDSTSTRTDWIEADTYYTITETTIKTLKSLTVSANNYITQTLETSDLDIDITLSPNIKYVSKIKNNGVVYTLKDESIDGKVEGLANKTLSNVSSIDNNSAVATALNGKQATLVSGTNIKTINNNSLLGSGNVTIDSLPSQSGQSGKFLTTNGTTASWSTVSIPTVDQTFDGTSANAQSGVAIEGELANYVKGQNGNITISNNGTEASIMYVYEEEGTPQQAYGITLGDTSSGDGVFLVSADRAEQKGYMAGVVPDGFGIEDVLNNRGALLSVLSNGNLAVNGTEVALSTDIPDISTKQDTLVSGTNIKTINNTSLLGSGNLSVGTVKSVNNTQPDNNGNVSLTIPTVNNATLTIQKNGTTVNTFTANASSDVTCNITVPTAVTDLSDASNYVTNTGLSTILDDYATEQWAQQQASSLYTSIQGWVNNQGYAVSADLADVATTGDYDDLLNKPTIPQAQIQSDWNQTDSSAVDFIKNKPTIPSGVIVDQTFDPTSTNAQSGVAIAGELANYLQASNGNVTFTNGGTTGGVAYADSSTGEMYGTFIGQTQWGDGVMMGAVNPNGYLLGVAPSGINIIKGTVTSATNGIALTVTNNNALAVNGSEVALSANIPTKISDITDDTATYPVDKADTLTNLTATVAELNYTDGVTSNIQTQFNTITGKIPSQASTSNQLADKAFVNSSVQTATANFRGNWDTWTLVPTSASSYPADYAGSTTPTVNDYLVVQDASDYTGDTLEGTWRFKYTGVWSTNGKSGWNPEYQVNETPLTSAQLAALNSGITSNDVTLIGTALQPNDNISELTDDTATYPIDKAESVVDNNSGNLKFWSGTQAEYNNYEINTDVLTIYGTPTFNIKTGVASEFTTNKYFRVIATSGDTIYLKIKATDVQTKQGIFGNDVSIGIYNGYLGYNTQSGSGVFTNVAEITANQYIYLKIYITGTFGDSSYFCSAYYNFDGSSNYNTIIAGSSNLFNRLTLGIGYIEGSIYPFNGEINLSESYLVSNNQTEYFVNNVHENNIVYITTDTNKIYKGDILLSDDNSKQNTLVSGANIKTVNSTSLLGSGDISVGTVKSVNNTSPDSNGNVSLTIPTVPTNISAFTNDSGYITSSTLTDYVTTNTDQNITGTKTYVGQKKIGFKQSSSSDKLGFTLYNNSNVEKGYLEYNPSNTVDSVPLMTLGNYASTSGGLTHVGFRKYSSISGASGAYNLLAPLISDAKTPFSLTTTYTNFYLPLGFTDGTTTVKTAKTGVVDLSSILPDISTKQDTLVSGTNIKTINDASVLGSGNIEVQNKLTAGDNITIYESGYKWSTGVQINNLSSSSWNCMTYDGNKFVSIRYDGYVSTSIDGLTWTTPVYVANLDTEDYTLNWSDLIYDGTKFVALGEYGHISTSTDGITWTEAIDVENLGENAGWHCLAYNGSIYIAIGINGWFSTSTDGITWTYYTQNSGLQFTDTTVKSIAFGNGKFIAVGYGYYSVSSDGTTWTKTQAFGFGGDAICFDGTKFVSVGLDAAVESTTNGTSWVSIGTPPSGMGNNAYNFSLSYNGDKFVLLDDEGYISLSTSVISSDINLKTINNTSLKGTGNVSVQPTLVSGTNIKTINNTSILGSGNIDTSEIFIAQYDSTTYNEILTAYNAGKEIICRDSGVFFILSGINLNNNVFAFSNNTSTQHILKTIANNVWTTSVTNVAKSDLSNVSSISSSSAVYTALGNKQDTLVSGTNIKTVNNTSLLGSGNLSLADTTLSNVSSIASSSAVKTALDTKVNTSDIWYDSTTSTLYIGVAQS